MIPMFTTVRVLPTAELPEEEEHNLGRVGYIAGIDDFQGHVTYWVKFIDPEEQFLEHAYQFGASQLEIVHPKWEVMFYNTASRGVDHITQFALDGWEPCGMSGSHFMFKRQVK